MYLLSQADPWWQELKEIFWIKDQEEIMLSEMKLNRQYWSTCNTELIDR